MLPIEAFQRALCRVYPGAATSAPALNSTMAKKQFCMQNNFTLPLLNFFE